MFLQIQWGTNAPCPPNDVRVYGCVKVLYGILIVGEPIIDPVMGGHYIIISEYIVTHQLLCAAVRSMSNYSLSAYMTVTIHRRPNSAPRHLLSLENFAIYIKLYAIMLRGNVEKGRKGVKENGERELGKESELTDR